MKKLFSKKNIEHSLTARFCQEGCKLEFDNHVELNMTERELFCLYLKSEEDVFVELAFIKLRQHELSRSVLFLHVTVVLLMENLIRGDSLPDNTTIDYIVSRAPYDYTEGCVTREWVLNLYNIMKASAEKNAITEGQPTIKEYLETKRVAANARANLFIHIVENADEDVHPFILLITYDKQQEDGTHIQLTIGNIFDSDGNESLKQHISAELKNIALKNEILARFIKSGAIKASVPLTLDEAYELLKSVKQFSDMGFNCRIPNWWKKRSRKIEITVKIGDDNKSLLGLDEILSFNASLSVEGEELTEDEVKLLLTRANGLIMIKGKWIDVDPARLKATLDAYEQAKELMEYGNITLRDAMRLMLMTHDSEIEGGKINYEFAEILKKTFNDMNMPERLKNIDVGAGFLTKLRPYQQVGVNWLYFLHTLKLGACLSDDMGLGKTVQAIALLEKLRSEKTRPSLLIIPASLLQNWQNELLRFAPNIKFKVLHNSVVQTIPDSEADLFITTYTMATRDIQLRQRKYDTIILDEAQAIKNPATKQARAIKKIEADARICMTGTPIENHIGDLWSIFDFLNPSLLGTASDFSRIAASMSTNKEVSAKLRGTVAPFILRRLKTDTAIIPELPEKIEMKSFCSLTRKQTALYQSVLDNLEKSLFTATGIGRRGLVLSSIMRLKQICNHPDQYLGAKNYLERDSGKMTRLRELCEEIRDNHERVLIFTQFLEMCEPLVNFLNGIFGVSGLTINGSVPINKRQEIVNLFNGDEYVPFMVLTIKAGGIGLNLTGANHVIHFDRWWNPAIENQATDRAYRIGQNKNVIVHKLIMSRTLEEKIDELIEGKRILAENIIPSVGEAGITELMNDDLINFLRLSQ
ncbi:MAG: DEAD/DEAH box helicase [Clostridia bacterium]